MALPTPANLNTASPKFLLNFPAGLNENQTPNIGEASAGWNFELGARQSKLIPRLPFDLKGTAPNASEITGISQLTKRSTGVQTTLVFAGNTCYEWDGASTWTSKGAITAGGKMRDAYWSLGDYNIIVDNSTNANIVKTWDGTTFADMTTGLAGTFSAKYVIIHLNRAWFFNITSAGVNYPHMIVASTFENPLSLDITKRSGPTNQGGSTFATGLEAFYLLTPDLKAINGVALFQNVLIISTVEGQLFKLTGVSASDFLFTPFYVGSSAVGTESIINIGNDVSYIRKGGNINLMKSVQYFGDVRSNDIARWIPTTTQDITDSLIVYEQDSQRVFFFIQDKVLVLYKDILYAAETDSAINSGLSPWSVYITDHASKFNTKAARYMYRPGTLTYSTYWGDSSGNIYDMNGTGTNDAGVYSVNCSRTSRLIDEEVLNPFPYAQEILIGRIQYKRISSPSSMNISFQWSDEYNTSISSITLKGPPTGNIGFIWNLSSYWGASYWSQGFQFANVISHQTFSPTGKGTGFYITLGNQGAAQWQVDHLELF